MDRAILTIDRGGSQVEDDIAARKREHALGLLGICRDVIERTDVSDRDGWRRVVCELIDGGFDESEIESELAASRNTIYKWKTGLAAPREMTRRLLRRSILEMVDERIARLSPQR
jgi:Trp operon repressor